MKKILALVGLMLLAGFLAGTFLQSLQPKEISTNGCSKKMLELQLCK